MYPSDFAINRTKAQLACESRIRKTLFSAARQIVLLSSKYRRGARLAGEHSFLSASQRITSELTDDIEQYIAIYSRASCSILEIGTVGIDNFLDSKVFGMTSRQRTSAYLKNFAEDIVRMAKAGILMGYGPDKILSAVRTGYIDPYRTSVITKARRKDINIATPSYGRGIFHAAYQNIARNARQMVALAWGRAEQQYGKQSGAVGYRIYRGSSFPCAQCDDETLYIHHFGDPFPPLHNNCRCFVRFIYENNKNNNDT